MRREEGRSRENEERNEMTAVGGWKIPERKPISTSSARMEELRRSTESHIANQHAVSRAILKEFAAPAAGGRGWTLIPYDVKLKKHKRPLGLKGCGKVLLPNRGNYFSRADVGRS